VTRTARRWLLLAVALVPGLAARVGTGATPAPAAPPFAVVLGIAQDGGYPQAGTKESAAWNDPAQRRLVASLAVVDPQSGERWLVDCTPDFPQQLHRLDEIAPAEGTPGLAGILLTHAHVGHYAGLIHLGREAMAAKEVPVYAMPRMADFLRKNGPWELLVRLRNVVIAPLAAGVPVRLGARLTATPLLVPHRDEYSETVAFRIAGPTRKLLWLPDIDKWEKWDEQGTKLEDVLASVDVAYLDGTFFADGEVPGRPMAEIPHPFVREGAGGGQGDPQRDPARERRSHVLVHGRPEDPPLPRASKFSAWGRARRIFVWRRRLVPSRKRVGRRRDPRRRRRHGRTHG